MGNILLVEPSYPIPTKSKNHKNFLPIGLLKLSSYYKQDPTNNVELVRGNTHPNKFKEPSIIEITSLFTYWSDYLWNTVEFYRYNYPSSKIRIGGIYTSLHHNKRDFLNRCKKFNIEYHKGVFEPAEELFPDYKCILEKKESIDFQIVHSSRGCFRKCSFCGTWVIEPEFKVRNTIYDLIKPGLDLGLKNLVFYDNNLFYNPHIEKILKELVKLKKEKKIGWCESQSGFDGRILLKKPHLANLLKKAGFRYPRIAWDWGYDQWSKIEKQIQILIDAGYSRKNITVFMIYNWKLNFDEMERKRIKCWKWGVQISDCRNRPLSQLHDHYKPLKNQSSGEDYYIHPDWTDAEVKQFRKNVRRQNICNRQGLPYHSKLLENKKHYTKEQYNLIKAMSLKDAKKFLPDLWIPSKITKPENRYKWESKKVKPPKKVPYYSVLEKRNATKTDYSEKEIEYSSVPLTTPLTTTP